MLNCGHNRVSPSNGMWPLFCNEVGLSYDQEERVRSFQREVISRNETWLYRHVSYGSQHIMKSLHDAIIGSCELAKRRDKSVMDILTDEQKMKFLAWKAEKMKRFSGGPKDGALLLDKLSQALEKKLNLGGGGGGGGGSHSSPSPVFSSPMETDNFPTTTSGQGSAVVKSTISNNTEKIAALSGCQETNANNHDAANLYIVNHRLLSITNASLPVILPCQMNPSALKRLSRRPSFESLAAVHDEPSPGGGGKKGGKKQQQGGNMARVISSGSLKRCSSEMSCDENGPIMNAMKKSSSAHSLSSAAALVAATPEAAQVASAHAVSAALGSVRSLIPAMIVNRIVTRPAVVVNNRGARPRANTIASTVQSDYITSGMIHDNGSHTVYQQQQQQSSTIQPIYQPSSTIIPVSNASGQQQSNVMFTNTQSYTPQQEVAPVQNTATYSYNNNNNMNTVIPNTIQSSVVNPTENMNKNTFVSPEQYSTPATIGSYSTASTFNPVNQQQIQTLNSGNSFPPGPNNNKTIASVNSTSAPVIKSASLVPSPLLLSDQTNHQQQQSQNQNDTTMDMILDDSVLQPYDVTGSFYNVPNQEADDSLFELTEEDWAIGEGAFLDP